MRPSNRRPDELRAVRITRRYTRHAEGSVLIECGDTKVLCTASVEEKVPGFLKGRGQGWVTAEYGMLPRSTNTRMDREAARGKQSGRTQEIQRLIGRALRAVVDAVTFRLDKKLITATPIQDAVAAVSVGIFKGVPVLDLDYAEDSNCDTDMNVVMTGKGGMVEVQGTAEGVPFTRDELNALLEHAQNGIGQLIVAQRAALAV